MFKWGNRQEGEYEAGSGEEGNGEKVPTGSAHTGVWVEDEPMDRRYR